MFVSQFGHICHKTEQMFAQGANGTRSRPTQMCPYSAMQTRQAVYLHCSMSSQTYNLTKPHAEGGGAEEGKGRGRGEQGHDTTSIKR